MTENNRIEYKRELTDGLEKELLNIDEKISGVESAMVYRRTCKRVGHCKEFK